MNFPIKFISNNENDTKNIALELTKILTNGDIVVLDGDLGAGKTFLVKQFAKLFNLENVNSPTFAIVNVYDGEIKINHFDFYRIEEQRELLDIGFNDYISDQDAITFIEWGSLYSELLPNKCYIISITFDEELNRIFEINRRDK
ncbi:MAG: tRNA (adenosine(37)-N6)-threonylcarbamoyltransferase complex ATPase subunit type 1 TsaE [Bacteroidota bacterium]|nr:tRNA (adenosine(37)-N6)-threonylcarbamoyltransferase complex ATPase subunit type 1 TsaE [Bacteroidota bacterium]